jgi:polar amino acid transport system substrate-binding protein
MRTMVLRITVLFALVLGVSPAYAEDHGQLGVTASPWSPYVSRSLAGKGIAVSIVTAALERAGYKTTFALQEWPRDLEGTRLGVYDVIASIWHTEARARDLVFSEPIYENRIVFMALTDSDIPVEEVEALKGYRVGVVEDYAYTQGTYSDLQQVELIVAGTVEQNLQRLIAGEIDVAVSDEQVALYVLNEGIPEGIRKVRFSKKPLATRALRMAVSRKRSDAEQIIANFNAALKVMQEDGGYQDILHRFRVSP